MSFTNSYADDRRAEAYATLEFPGTYYLAYRDLPEIIRTHVKGTQAVDFGCGAGRSTRFLRGLGFAVLGVDISAEMIRKAREIDPAGDYRHIGAGDLPGLGPGAFDLVMSVFTFDNIPGHDNRIRLWGELGGLLRPGGRIVCLDSTPELYTNQWASFSTVEFPGNRSARSGDTVCTTMVDVEDRRPVEDIFWTDEDYRGGFSRAGLEPVQTYRPLGREDEPSHWVSEARIPPWVIYVLKKIQA